MIVITGCDQKYLPGVRALRNSIDKHADDIELWCLAYGDNELVGDLTSLGINVIVNPNFPEDTRFPIGGMWVGREEDMPVMYSRILIPEMFDDEERVMWLDADTLVKGSLDELLDFDMQGHPVAMPPLKEDKWCAGVMLFDVQEWNDSNVLDEYLALMNTYKAAPRGVVETLLNECLEGRIATLPEGYYFNAKKRDPDKGDRILHFPVVVPWDLSINLGKAKPEHIRKAVKKHWEPYR